jgi:hypothetical protein
MNGVLVASYAFGSKSAFTLLLCFNGGSNFENLRIFLEPIDEKIALMVIVQLDTIRTVSAQITNRRLTISVALPKMADSRALDCCDASAAVTSG